MDAARIDRWLWAIRLCKTRSQATAACRAGHVRVNGKPAKPATAVATGDRVEARLHGRQRVLDVVDAIQTRVGAPLAATCYVDRSPPPPPVDDLLAGPRRTPGSGRPTKRERRRLDRWRADG